tara:strand:- start:34 stop:744 length:711 start_codon:yes stop_codon:yes gene_type:complete
MKYLLLIITLLLLIFYLINKISSNYIIKNIKNYFIKEKQSDFYENINLPSNHSNKLNDFFKSMITKNHFFNNNIKSKTFKADEIGSGVIRTYLQKKFKSGSKEIKNIHIGSQVLFKKCSTGYEFKPILIIGEYYYNKKRIGVVKLQMELCFVIEKNGNLFINPNKFNNKCGTYFINRLFLIDFNKELKLKNKLSESSELESDIKYTDNTISISSILSEDLMMSSDINSSLLSFSSI